MKKITRYFVVLCMMLLLASGTVFAGQQGNVYDDGELLSETELSTLSESIDTFVEKSGWNVYALTTEDAGGKTSQAYADDFYDEMVPGTDGLALLIDMDNREITVSTSGIAIRYLTDERIENILDAGYEYVSDGDYYGCFDAMLEEVSYYYNAGIEDGQYNYDVETGEISRYYSLSATEVVTAIVAGVAVAVIVFLCIVGKYRLKFGSYKYDFRQNGYLKLTEKEDVFVNQHVVHHHIQRESSSGGSGSTSSGRSSTHTSSSGQTQGGGSRKF